MVTIPRVHARTYNEFLSAYRVVSAACLLGYRLYYVLSEGTLNLLLDEIRDGGLRLLDLSAPFHHSTDQNPFARFIIRGLN